VPLSFYNGEELLKLIREGKSIVRYGDGEVRMMNYGSLAFQDYRASLREGLLKAYKGYSENSPYILGVNDRAVLATNEQQANEGTLQLLLPQKVYASLFLPKKAKYMDASFFYYNENVQEYLVEAFKGREVIFVSRKETLESIRNNPHYPYLNHTHFIETKEKNAFDEYLLVCASVDSVISQLPKESGKPLIIAAFGAGTKVFAYEYAMKGVQVLDIGTGIEIIYQEKRIDGILKPKK